MVLCMLSVTNPAVYAARRERDALHVGRRPLEHPRDAGAPTNDPASNLLDERRFPGAVSHCILNLTGAAGVRRVRHVPPAVEPLAARAVVSEHQRGASL